MLCYKDVTYCDTPKNKCINIDCPRHQETTDEHYSLKHNTDDLPIAVTDFSEYCDGFVKDD